MAKTILFVGGGIETLPGLHLAKQMGLRVVVSDRNPQAPCFTEADAALIADTYDPKETLLAALAYMRDHGPIHGVLCLGSDIPWTCAVVAQALGLPGLPLTAAALAMNKLAMKERLAAHDVAVPFFTALPDKAALKALLAKRGLPLVVKPTDSRGARGVIRLTKAEDADWAFDYARECSPTGTVMAEAYLSGPQLSTESLVVNGVTHTPGMSDRNYDLLDLYAPFFIEDGGDLPSHLPEQTLAEVRELVQRAGEAMGIKDGVVKGDIVVHEGRAYVIEVAARLSGGYFCTHTIPMNTGVELVRHAILQALGEAVDVTQLQPTRNTHVCQRYLFPRPGKVTHIEGVETARAMTGITYLEIRVKQGDKVALMENHPARAGVLMAQGESREQARAIAEAAVAAIRITTA